MHIAVATTTGSAGIYRLGDTPRAHNPVNRYDIEIYRQRAELQRKFNQLAKVWREETADVSSTTELLSHPAYIKIIGMGMKAIPMIISELEREPDHWFHALTAITGENPVAPDQIGNILEMRQEWLRWAEQSVYG